MNGLAIHHYKQIICHCTTNTTVILKAPYPLDIWGKHHFERLILQLFALFWQIVYNVIVGLKGGLSSLKEYTTSFFCIEHWVNRVRKQAIFQYLHDTRYAVQVKKYGQQSWIEPRYQWKVATQKEVSYALVDTRYKEFGLLNLVGGGLESQDKE